MKHEIKVRYEGLYTVANTVDGKCLDVENLFSGITHDIRQVILEAEYREEVRYMVWQVEDDAKGLIYKVDNFIRELSWMSKELRDAAEYYKYTEDRISRELEKIGGFGLESTETSYDTPIRTGIRASSLAGSAIPYLWNITDKINFGIAFNSQSESLLKPSGFREYIIDRPAESISEYDKYMMKTDLVKKYVKTVEEKRRLNPGMASRTGLAKIPDYSEAEKKLVGEVALGSIQFVGGIFETAFAVGVGAVSTVTGVAAIPGDLFATYVAMDGISNVSGGFSKVINAFNGTYQGDTWNYMKIAYKQADSQNGEKYYNYSQIVLGATTLGTGTIKTATSVKLAGVETGKLLTYTGTKLDSLPVSVLSGSIDIFNINSTDKSLRKDNVNEDEQ